MNPDQDALALIAGIERASRRSRPFFLFGLLAVILGFVSVSVYLYQDREEERAQKAVLEKQVAELGGTLNRARALLPELDDSAAAREQLRILLGQASATARALPAAVASAESGNPARSAPPPPEKAALPPEGRPASGPVETATAPSNETLPDTIRLIIHVSDPRQRAAASQLSLGLTRLGERRIETEIRQVSRGQDNSLRCLRQAECALADQLTALINSRLRSPAIRKRDFTIYHLNLSNIPPGTYELWFRPGPIELRALGE